MRVIAGEFRGRNLLAPASEVTRPVTDRVKQSVFDILSPYMDDAVVYDCFAGTGSMGLECLSRGAAHATFFEADRSAAERLRRNIGTLKVEGRSTVVATDLFKWFSTARKPGSRPAELIFLDPPYRFLNERPEELRKLAEAFAARHLSPTALVIFRHDAKDALELPALHVRDVREYGSMTVELLGLPPNGDAPPQ
ncbi:MAG TPA: 16S rRNA (guanine(966)-N(2))-methyltransferase RsmD [Tepidisphaeraceae bacterium]|jgi:16S rRNA (guanine966-N2)-methyltransferase|nr:16S rRNA (guanine(966)-N(2))-methyltransferase RsmD [Tepidisphaeraceae bacterium]